MCVCATLAINLIDIKIHGQRKNAASNGIWRAMRTWVCLCVSVAQPPLAADSERFASEWNGFAGAHKSLFATGERVAYVSLAFNKWHPFNISHFAIATAHIAMHYIIRLADFFRRCSFVSLVNHRANRKMYGISAITINWVGPSDTVSHWMEMNVLCADPKRTLEFTPFTCT